VDSGPSRSVSPLTPLAGSGPSHIGGEDRGEARTARRATLRVSASPQAAVRAGRVRISTALTFGSALMMLRVQTSAVLGGGEQSPHATCCLCFLAILRA
jgi:hypothetical protein